MKVIVGQINPKIGDITGNLRAMEAVLEAGRAAGADLATFPEMAVCGYPPKDLLLRASFVRRCELAIGELAKAVRRTGVAAVAGTVSRNPGEGAPLFNSAAVIRVGGEPEWYHKRFLPTYDVFDETRYFAPGDAPCVTAIRGQRVAVTICEDMWGGAEMPDTMRHRYPGDPVADSVAVGADMVVNISASPFSVGKQAVRESLVRSHADSLGVPFVYANQVGANDDLVFDGGSMVALPGGQTVQAAAFSACELVADTDRASGSSHPYPASIQSIWDALVLGVRDYYRKSGIFNGVVVGLSGGIDSALTAAVAVEALGANLVHGVAMPSRHSSDHSLEDAQALADNLGIDHRVIPIIGKVAATEDALAASFGPGPAPEGDVSSENIQARARGDILMALSNRFGWLLLTTGNKSELAVGYCTLHGDMCGGLAVLSDVPKGLVYGVSEHANRAAGSDIIPRRTIKKPPSAELRPGQTDQDTLPPYPVLDAILEAYVEHGATPGEIASTLDPSDAHWASRVARMVDRNEHKRQQAAIGLRVTSRAFGQGWRMPIVAAID